MNKNDYEVDLNKVLLDYCESNDGSLINGDVYEALKKISVSVASPFVATYPIYKNYDELMSVCDIAIFTALSKYDKSKGKSLITYLWTCIRNALLMDMRKIRKHKMVTKSIYECINKYSDIGDRIYLIDIIEDVESSKFADFNSDERLIDCVKESLLHLLKEKKINDKTYKIFIMYLLDGKNQNDIANELELSQSYISRLIRKTTELIAEDLYI